MVRHSFWSEFCDFYLEAIKVEPLGEMRETAEVLFHAFTTYLKLFHPFLPFVTEVLWEELVGEGMLIGASWPEAVEAYRFSEESEGVSTVMRLVAAVRGIRAEQGLEPGAKIEVAVRVKAHGEALRASRTILERLVRAESLALVEEGEIASEGASVAVDPAFDAAVRLGQADREAERKRLHKQLEDARKRLQGLERQLANENFVTRAKPEAVEKVRNEAEKMRTTVAALEERLGDG